MHLEKVCLTAGNVNQAPVLVIQRPDGQRASDSILPEYPGRISTTPGVLLLGSFLITSTTLVQGIKVPH